MSPLKNTLMKKMSPETQIGDFTRLQNYRGMTMCRTESNKLDKTGLPLSTAAPVALLYNDLTQEVHDSFVSSCLLSKTIACLSKQGLGLAAKKRQRMLGVRITSLLLVFFRGWGQSVATQENTEASNTE